MRDLGGRDSRHCPVRIGATSSGPIVPRVVHLHPDGIRLYQIVGCRWRRSHVAATAPGPLLRRAAPGVLSLPARDRDRNTMPVATVSEETTPETGVTSFAKSLFLGEIHDDLVFPFPEPDPEERPKVRALTQSLREFAAEAIDPRKI